MNLYKNYFIFFLCATCITINSTHAMEEEAQALINPDDIDIAVSEEECGTGLLNDQFIKLSVITRVVQHLVLNLEYKMPPAPGQAQKLHRTMSLIDHNKDLFSLHIYFDQIKHPQTPRLYNQLCRALQKSITRAIEEVIAYNKRGHYTNQDVCHKHLHLRTLEVTPVQQVLLFNKFYRLFSPEQRVLIPDDPISTVDLITILTLVRDTLLAPIPT